MARWTRRSFLKKTAVGLGVAGALAAVPGVLLARDGSGIQESASIPPDANSTPLVAYIRDASKGEVAVMVGTEEVIERDPVLVSRLLAAMRSRA